ncbi:MAG: head protein [Candidatus Nitronauta litoralis]|uniref:Head protein n=1 Tax=Candidatus Nitronauta litoralis TaxID=2705533 RepID=A0A7T0FZY0_9BACT|nr:MAG: head protein [Candidatus Nitronauta litoralis]
MLVNASVIQGLFTNLKTTFNKAFAAVEPVWPKIAMEVPSTGASNDYSWLSMFPKMREWIGEKYVKALEAFNYQLVNRDFEATVEVKRKHIEDDQIGIYSPLAKDAAHSAKTWPDELIFEVVNGAFASLCFDGQYFIDTDHPVGDGVVSNKITVKLKAGTLAEAQASFGAAKTKMREFKDDEGRPLGLRPNVLLVPPALEDTANLLMDSERLQDGKQNPYRNSAEVVVGDYLTDPDAWFLLDTTRPVKPFIFQPRKRPVFVSQVNMESDDVFMKAVYKYGAESRGNAGYGFWQLAVGSDGSTG